MTGKRLPFRFGFGILISVLFLVACSSEETANRSTESNVEGSENSVPSEISETALREEPYSLTRIPEFDIVVTSSAINSRGRLNKYYTCEGADVSPDLSWSGTPDGTESFVVLMEDPASDEIQGGTIWTHWILYSIPKTVTQLPEDLTTDSVLDNGFTYGTNDYGNSFYSGPCPEPTIYIKIENCGGSGSGCANKTTVPAKLRPYNFFVYALDKEVKLEPGTTRNKVLKEIEDHILGAGMLAGEYRSGKTKGSFQHD